MVRLIVLLSVLLPVISAFDKKIIRPCHLNDLRCIRDNLKANSDCGSKVVGSIPGQYTIYHATFEAPYFNASYIDEYLTIKNHNKCFVSEFFFNTNTDTAVLSVDCPRLGFEANRTLIQHHSLQEDTYYSFKISADYPLVRLTTNLKHADRLDLCSSFTFADVTALPIFNINPNNKPTASFLSYDLSVLYIYEREMFASRANLLLRRFVNSYICKFKCLNQDFTDRDKN